ncbi:MAG TPA: SH3 domain-containing protein [Bacteroidales bacterium]|nr:SH3 domain-containing protein [Bacteroidales bacterium]
MIKAINPIVLWSFVFLLFGAIWGVFVATRKFKLKPQFKIYCILGLILFGLIVGVISQPLVYGSSKITSYDLVENVINNNDNSTSESNKTIVQYQSKKKADVQNNNELLKSNNFNGNVGKLDAIFILNWYTDGRVEGTYYYPSRKGIVYSLKGTENSQGSLVLDEYTNDKLSANCELQKSNDCYEGTMKNTDGRSFDMKFCIQNGPSGNVYSQLIINGSKVNIRSAPALDAGVIIQLNTGDKCDIIDTGMMETIKGSSNFWYKIRFNDKVGWVFGDFTSLSGNLSNQTKNGDNNLGQLTINGTKVNVREKPGITAQVIMQLNTGDKCEIISKGNQVTVNGSSNYWYKINFNGKTGWVFGVFVKL